MSYRLSYGAEKGGVENAGEKSIMELWIFIGNENMKI